MTTYSRWHIIEACVNIDQPHFAGKYSLAGCTLKFMLDWAWRKVTQIKQYIDLTTKPLFDHSCFELTKETKNVLFHKSQELGHLTLVLDNLNNQKNSLSSSIFVSSERGMEELATKSSVCSMINQYLDIILWFANARLLPESSNNYNHDEEVNNTKMFFLS